MSSSARDEVGQSLIQPDSIRKPIVVTHLNHILNPLDISSSSVGPVHLTQLLQNSRQKERRGYPQDPIFFVTFYRGQSYSSMVFTTLSNHANTLHLCGTFQCYLYVFHKVL